MRTERVSFLGIDFDCLTMSDVLARIKTVSDGSPYTYLATPNVDHIVRANYVAPDEDLKALYNKADICVCDSRVLSKIARFFGFDMPVVPGSDLTVQVLEHIVRPNDRVAIVGGDDALLGELRDRHPGVTFIRHEPPMGLRHRPEARNDAARFVANSASRFALIAVGSPQQEMIAAEIRRFEDARGMALCIGASLDFIVGRQRRAPLFFQRLSLEWAYRLMTQPRRMWRRYLVEGPKIFILAARYRWGHAGR